MWKFLFFAAMLFAICTSLTAQLTYPVTKKVNQSDLYFGVKVDDPYRWFENDSAAEVKSWIKEQNKLSDNYLSAIPFREKIRQRIRELNDVPFYLSPIRVGEYYFYTYNSGLQPQDVIYRQKGLTGKGEVFIDPNILSAEGTTSVWLSGYSEDNKFVSTITRKSGSDWGEINVREVSTGKQMSDEIKWVKGTNISWKGKGFFYSRYPSPSAGTELSMKNENQKIYFHKLGTPQQEDLLIFEDKTNPLTFNRASVSEDKRFLIIYSFSGQNNTDIYYWDFQSPDTIIKILVTGTNNVEERFVTSKEDKLIFYTRRNAPNGKVVLINPASPDPSQWENITAEQPELLENAHAIGGKLFLGYLKDVTSKYYQYTYDGKLEREVKFPDLGSAYQFEGLETDSIVFYGFSSFLYPHTVFRYNIKTGVSEVHYIMNAKMKAEDYQTKQVFYNGKDGAKVPMFIVSKKGIKYDGNHPALLYAYGGYSVNVGPGFNPGIFPLLDAGGVYAVANIRGGGEYGEQWHQDGMLLRTQNRFDDFIAAAEFLIANGYTSASKLGITGRSHGGCLVGSVMLQRPDLFKVAMPVVGTLDMLRFHKFTVGWNWVREYGHPDSLHHFKNLLAYSPVHNVKPGMEYPATLVMTADHDDRVVPMHSFKFISELQAKQAGANPVIIRIDTNSGHSGSSFLKDLDSFADVVSFLLYNTESKLQL